MHSTGKGTIFQIVCHRLVGRASEDIKYRSAGTLRDSDFVTRQNTYLAHCNNDRKRPGGTISL